MAAKESDLKRRLLRVEERMRNPNSEIHVDGLLVRINESV